MRSKVAIPPGFQEALQMRQTKRKSHFRTVNVPDDMEPGAPFFLVRLRYALGRRLESMPDIEAVRHLLDFYASMGVLEATSRFEFDGKRYSMVDATMHG